MYLQDVNEKIVNIEEYGNNHAKMVGISQGGTAYGEKEGGGGSAHGGTVDGNGAGIGAVGYGGRADGTGVGGSDGGGR